MIIHFLKLLPLQYVYLFYISTKKEGNVIIPFFQKTRHQSVIGFATKKRLPQNCNITRILWLFLSGYHVKGLYCKQLLEIPFLPSGGPFITTFRVGQNVSHSNHIPSRTLYRSQICQISVLTSFCRESFPFFSEGHSFRIRQIVIWELIWRWLFTRGMALATIRLS